MEKEEVHENPKENSKVEEVEKEEVHESINL